MRRRFIDTLGFRGRKAAASLKLLERGGQSHHLHRFRGRKAAASLKLVAGYTVDENGVEIPRPQGRGLIEARVCTWRARRRAN